MAPNSQNIVKSMLRAEGFSCPSCVGKIEKQVHFASSRIEVEHDPEVVSVDDVVAAVGKAGYKAHASAF